MSAAIIIKLILDNICRWIEAKAEYVEGTYYSAVAKARWLNWMNVPGKNGRYYQLIIRLPSYAWAYRINTDEFGWMQRAIFWRSSNAAHFRGWSVQKLMPLS